MNRIVRLFSACLITLLFTAPVNGQEVITPLAGNPSARAFYQNNVSLKKAAAADTLELPFFDDFSGTYIMPDPDKWSDAGAFVNNSYCVDPVSNGVATLDAIDFDGSLYPGVSSNPFVADMLTSLPIRLSYPASDSIYLSFLYQPTGLGDAPEEADSLMVDFFSPDSARWTNVWRIPGPGDDTAQEFRHVLIPVTGGGYLSDGFRFRFRNRASIPGNPDFPEWDANVDHWHVDYVQLDRQRHAADTILRDVAFTSPLNSILKDLTSVPWSHFGEAYTTLFDGNEKVHARYRNNDTISRNITRSIYFEEPYYNESERPFEPTAQDLPPLQDTVVNFDYFYSLNSTRGDSALLRFRAALRTDDFDPKVNDTVVLDQFFRDYYAYDDGTPEAGYGLRAQGTKNGVVAMKYHAYKPDLLGGIEVSFNQLADSINMDYYFKLMVWGDNSDAPGTIIWEDGNDHTPAYAGSHPGFVRYYFTEPVPVDGPFYIGWRQYNQYMLHVGLDLNNRPSPQVMFYNFEGSWTRSNAPGVMLLRPFMYDETTGIRTGEKTGESLQLYPNPASGLVHIVFPGDTPDRGTAVDLYDTSGRFAGSTWSQTGTLDITRFPAGLYFLKIRSGEKVYFAKLLINR